jgi:hypothetical protein
MNLIGELGASKQMWLNNGGVATIIPLKQIELIWPVSYDSGSNGGLFSIHSNQGDIVVCNNNKGMPFIDLRDLETDLVLGINKDAALAIIQAMDNADVALTQTVHGNMNGLTEHKFKDAHATRKGQAMLGHPTDCKFLGMVRNNMITSYPVTSPTLTNTITIFGPDLAGAGVRGRTVRRLPDAVTTEYMQIPQSILDCFQLVTLAAGIMFANNIPFLVGVARGLNLLMTKHTPSRAANNLAAASKELWQSIHVVIFAWAPY